MISATKFATKFTSFWLECLGPMGYSFVQEANRRSQAIFPPMTSASDPKLHGGIGEVACQLFDASLTEPGLLRNKRRTLAAIKTMLSQASRFDRSAGSVDPQLAVLDRAGRNEALEIARRIGSFVDKYGRGRQIIPSPRFSGCGFIDESRGDLLLGDILYEIKAASRKFLLVDFRQLLIYLALNSAAASFDIKSVGLLNPRTGDHIQLSLEGFIRSISGKHSVELFAELIEFISGGGVSR